jgi:hypothetical protein
MAQSPKASARRCSSTPPTIRGPASCSPAHSWITQCRAPTGLPSFALAFNGTRCTTNPLGVKGCGEAGAIAAFPAIANAISDARAPLGITDLAGPATSERICRATAVKL